VPSSSSSVVASLPRLSRTSLALALAHTASHSLGRMLEPIDPLAFEEYQIPPSIIEESPVFSPPLMPEDINIFLSRFVCEAQLSSSIDDIVTSHKYTLSSASTDSGFGAESEWEEIVTVASLESIEMQRKAMPLEELLQRQDLAVVLEEDIKGADVKVDKWGFVIDETAGESNATLEESKKSKEDEAARAEKWVEVVAKWDTFSSDKKKKVRCVHCDPNHHRRRRHHHLDSGTRMSQYDERPRVDPLLPSIVHCVVSTDEIEVPQDGNP